MGGVKLLRGTMMSRDAEYYRKKYVNNDEYRQRRKDAVVRCVRGAMQDPERAERHRAVQKAANARLKAKDPEAYRARQRENCRRYAERKRMAAAVGHKPCSEGSFIDCKVAVCDNVSSLC